MLGIRAEAPNRPPHCPDQPSLFRMLVRGEGILLGEERRLKIRRLDEILAPPRQSACRRTWASARPFTRPLSRAHYNEIMRTIAECTRLCP